MNGAGPLAQQMNAKKTMEVGVFTGYSLLTTALALPEDGKHKIKFIQSNALTVLNDLVNSGEEESFDFIFVDARKNEYLKFHELTLKLVKIGGIKAYDNTLWYGLVVQEEDEAEDEFMRSMTNFIREFNSFVAADP
ncbi:hypothetical protein PTKIN_Ptkin09bG0250200 [Pterospermum kingtungense]